MDSAVFPRCVLSDVGKRYSALKFHDKRGFITGKHSGKTRVAWEGHPEYIDYPSSFVQQVESLPTDTKASEVNIPVSPLTAGEGCTGDFRKEVPMNILNFNLVSCAVPSFLWESIRAKMRVDDFVKKSVVFLGIEAGGRFIPLGTGFIGLVKYEDLSFQFLITAEHVIKDCLGDNRKTFSVRINRKDGGADVIKIDADVTNFTHGDRSLDLVLYAFGFATDIYDFTAVPLDKKVWADTRQKIWEPGPGDEVSVVGLYTSHHGQAKNIPIIRIGHIAAMPEEKVSTHRGYVLGYLMEVHSIAGLSGSPVFLNVPDVRVVDKVVQGLSAKTYIPLGMLIGYHTVETRDDEIVVPQFQEPLNTIPTEQKYKPPTEERRTGFGVVIPIEAIFHLVEHPIVQGRLKDAAMKHRANSGYKTASAKPISVDSDASKDAPTNTEAPSGKEGFNSLLGAAARKRKTDE